MKVFNNSRQIMSEAIKKSLETIRVMRGFDKNSYLESKMTVLNDYLFKNKLNSVVVAVSGGIDSAVVLSIAVAASKRSGSTIENITAITLPVFDDLAATNQEMTIRKAKELCEKNNVVLNIMNVTKSHKEIYQELEKSLGSGTSWARGQLSAYARTPFVYYATSILNTKGFSSVVLGTTNRDEGSYLGYVGKASDGMVDVQLISDIHKSEVFALANILNVPDSIKNAIPSGDMFDGRTDEEVFGTSYDFVELYLNIRNCSKETTEFLMSDWKAEDCKIYEENIEALESLHKYNKHKYYIGSPAVHLDVMPSSVKGGWQDRVHSTPHKGGLDGGVVFSERFVGFVATPPKLNKTKEDFYVEHFRLRHNNNATISRFKNIISESESEQIKNWMVLNKEKEIGTNVYGRVSNVKQGSKRLSFYSEEFAKILYERILLNGCLKTIVMPSLEYEKQLSDINKKVYKITGVNPMFRCLRYSAGDFLVPHYDESFVKNNVQRSLKTLIIGIEPSAAGGDTQFLFDTQSMLPYGERNRTDWDELVLKESMIDMSFRISAGEALMFDHGLLHQALPVQLGEKIILRSELMYESCEFEEQ